MEIAKKKISNIIPLRKKKNKCPDCNRYSSTTYAPFCSKKCSEKDLMKWLSDEHYSNFEIDKKK